jgi:hypothetical protein
MAIIDLNLPVDEEQADDLPDLNGVVPDQEEDGVVSDREEQAMIGAHENGHEGGVVLVDGIQVAHSFDLNFHDAEAQEEFIPG